VPKLAQACHLVRKASLAVKDHPPYVDTCPAHMSSFSAMNSPIPVPPAVPATHRFFWQGSDELLCVVECGGRFLAANPAWERRLGWSPSELLTTHAMELVHPDDVPCTTAATQGPADRMTFENRCRAADGSYQRLAWSVARENGRLYAIATEIAHRSAGVASFEIDLASGDASWSPEITRMFALASGAERRGIEALIANLPPPDAEAVREIVASVCRDGRPRQLEHCFMRDGEQRWAQTRLEAAPAEDRLLTLSGTTRDITARRRSERDMWVHGQLLDNVPAAVIATDLTGLVTHWNERAHELYGWRREEAIGRPITELTVMPDDGTIAEAIMATIRETGRWEGQYTVRRRDGSSFPAYVVDALITDQSGEPLGIMGVSMDITAQVEADRALRAANDHLTAVTDSVDEGVYTVDVEGRLVYINAAAERLLGWTPADLAGRRVHDVIHAHRPDGSPHPPDECPVLSAAKDGERVRVADDVFARRDGTLLPVEYTVTPLRTADGFQGSVCVFSDIRERKAQEARLQDKVETLKWIDRIRDALRSDRFVLHAQPIIDVTSGETVQHELLIRMLDESGKLVPPGMFLPVAEQSGVIREIDRWVIKQAVDLAARGHSVELNLSGESIGDPELATYLERELLDAGADASRIVIEITETALMGDEEAARAFVERAGALGCQVALDDFGTGYSGFRYLKRLPVDYLKIDIEFVRDLPRDSASRHVVRAVVELARNFGHRTVAEGVEDDETLALLRELGVDYAQGYGIGRPAPLSSVFDLR
jgi:PAS domain S-box-containing protein